MALQDENLHTQPTQGEANTKCMGCNKVKFKNCWYKILKFTFGKLSLYWRHDARLHTLWISTLCCKVDIICVI